MIDALAFKLSVVDASSPSDVLAVPYTIPHHTHTAFHAQTKVHTTITFSNTRQGCRPVTMAPTNRAPGYSPFKIFDPWFCRGVQSAIFHYATCQDYKNWKSAKARSKASEKLAKAREAEEAIISQQPQPMPQLQPLPFQTNKGWLTEINMGRNFDPTKAKTNRRISSGNTRPRADTSDSDRYDYYRANNPQSNDQTPPIASRLPPPERKHEVAWMKSPAPSRAIMEGKENPSEDAPQRWALCTIERTPEELRSAECSQQKETPKTNDNLQNLTEGVDIESVQTGQTDVSQQHTSSTERTLEELDYAKYAALKEILKRETTNRNWVEYAERETTKRDKRDDEQHYSMYMTPAEIGELALQTPQKPAKTHLVKPPRLLKKHTKERTEPDSFSESRVASWESSWESEPDWNNKYIFRPRGKPRISSLVAVQSGDKLEIRGASHNYDLFWKNDVENHTC